MHNDPPGLQPADINAILPQLPNHRGMLRIVGYYLLGWHHMVVFDVLDEQGNRVTDIRAEFPTDSPYLAAGTLYPIG